MPKPTSPTEDLFYRRIRECGVSKTALEMMKGAARLRNDLFVEAIMAGGAMTVDPETVKRIARDVDAVIRTAQAVWDGEEVEEEVEEVEEEVDPDEELLRQLREPIPPIEYIQQPDGSYMLAVGHNRMVAARQSRVKSVVATLHLYYGPNPSDDPPANLKDSPVPSPDSPVPSPDSPVPSPDSPVPSPEEQLDNLSKEEKSTQYHIIGEDNRNRQNIDIRFNCPTSDPEAIYALAVRALWNDWVPQALWNEWVLLSPIQWRVYKDNVPLNIGENY